MTARTTGLALAALLCAGASAHAQATGDNTFYRVSLRNTGEYTVGTSGAHPAGSGINVFYGGRWSDTVAPIVGQAPGTSRTTVRSYVTNREYILRVANTTPSPGFTCDSPSTDLGITPTIESIPTGSPAPTGARMTWHIVDAGEDLTVSEEVNAEGSTAADAVVRITTCITNNGAVNTRIGVRYLWDWTVGGDASTSPPPAPTASQDGPYIGIVPPDPPTEPFLAMETDWRNPTFDSYQASDSQNPSVTAPAIVVGATVTTGALVPPPTPPDLVRYSTWNNIRNTCFESSITPEPAGGVDAVMLFFWGDTPGNAKVIASGATWCATEYVVGSFTPPTPTCRVTARLTGGTGCETASALLDASGTTSANCASGVIEYRFLDPAGFEQRAWGTGATFPATSEGTWTVEARCQGDPSCSSSAQAAVTVETPPSTFDVVVNDPSPCTAGLDVTWPADWVGTAWGTNGVGAFALYRSEIDCADAFAQPPIATLLLTPSYTDTTAVPGVPYWYAVRAEALSPAQACPAGPDRGAPFREVCATAAVSDSASGGPPSEVGAALRVRKTAARVPELHWELSPALAVGESDVVVACTLDRAARPPVESQADLATRVTGLSWVHDPAPGTPLYYRVFRENSCGDRSAD